MKRTFVSVLALVLVFAMMLASCATDTPNTSENPSTDTSTPDASSVEPSNDPFAGYDVVRFDPSKKYVYKDSVSTLATNWNPHTYQTSDDAYPADFIRDGLYTFVFNDALHPSSVEGMEEYAGYAIIPAMAAAFPVDVTEAVKAKDGNKYGIPAEATSGYAYTIALNPNAVWEDGTPINADTYVYSLEKLLGSEYGNYRATDYYSSDLSIAGAEAFAKSGLTVKDDNSVDGEDMLFQVADLVEAADGTLKTADGATVYIGLKAPYAWMGGHSLADYYGAGYVPDDVWNPLNAAADEEGFVVATKAMLDTLFIFTNSGTWGNEPYEQLGYYLSYDNTYATVSFDTVGIEKTGEYEITLVLGKSLKDFYLLYNLSSNWIVKEDLYESCLTKDANGVWNSTYNTSIATTSSYGPYKLVEYNTDHSMRFVKNDKWYGYSSDAFYYVDPVDGKVYQLYQTTEVTCGVVAEAATRKEMFLKGQLMGYGLQPNDFDQYRSSERTYFTPSETIFFFIFNGYLDAIQQREANEGFDKAKYDIETISLKEFRQAIAVTYDKEALCTAVSPARSGGYGIIGNNYIYDPETGAKYRDTDQAKKALCDFYSVDTSKYDSLDAAVKSITGYDPVAAKELFGKAFEEALKRNYITSADGKTSDQIVRIEYTASTHNEFMEKTIKYLNEKLSEVLKGTPFEGKVEIYESAPYGDDWSKMIKSGLSDVVLGGWSGSALNPYSLSDLYCNPNNQYDAKWFNANAVNITINVDGKDLTMTMYEWSNALNGGVVEKDGKEYNFGYGMADTNLRLEILSRIENAVLQTYDYIPMLQDAGASLLSYQVYYVIEEYSSVMGRGGIAYMKYNYDEDEWKAYVEAETKDGESLKY